MTLEKLEFWNNLTDEQKLLLQKSFSVVSYKSGTIIHVSEYDCTGILLVNTGELRAYISSKEGREVTLFRLLPESVCVLSAACLISRNNININIDCIQDSQVTLINKDAINKLIQSNIYVENYLNKETVNKFSKVTEVMENVLFSKLDRRVGIFLIQESEKNNSLIIKITHDNIAKYIGSAREAVSKQLNIFSKDGLIKLERGKIVILNKKELEQIIK